MRVTRALATLGAAGVLAGGVVVTIALPSPAAEPPNPHAPAGTAAARWLAGELVNGTLPGFVGADWGLTIDALLALEATGQPEAAAVADAVDKDGAQNYTFPIGGGKSAWIAGATAKTLVAAVAAERDPKNFTGRDLRQATLDLVSATGDTAGQLQNQNTGNADGNTFDQSLGVIGLARSGGVPQPVVDFLIRQQCPAGGFRLGGSFAGDTVNCTADAAIDPDSTGMAVQALLEAGLPGAKEAAEKGAAYLAATQRADGSFGGSGPTADPNTNSTGLAGQALAAAGNTVAAGRAADWVARHQLTAENAGKAGAELGGIAYNKASFDDAVANGIADMQRDQWRRAGAQALLVLAKVPLSHRPPNPGPSEPSKPSESSRPSSPTSASQPSGVLPSRTNSVLPTSSQPRGTSSQQSGGYAQQHTSRQKPLAQTGSPITEVLFGGLVLVGAGIGLVFAGRRRSSR